MKKIEKRLRDAGYKMTRPRLCILQYLYSHHAAISAKQLHKKLKGIDLASIYRTLNLLERSRVMTVEIIKQEKIYCLTNKPHHHILCEQCGRMEKITCRHLFRNIKKFTNIYHQLTLTGICAHCAS